MSLLPPKRSKLASFVSGVRRGFSNFIKSLRPSGLLVELGAAAVCILLVTVIGTLMYDQVRHWVDDGHKVKQVERRSFFCSTHNNDGNRPAQTATVAELNGYDVRYLLEEARRRTEPTDVVGKLQNFFLCATISSAGLDSFGLSITPKQGAVADTVTVENAAKIQGRLRTIFLVVSDYPEEILQEQLRLLKNVIESAEENVVLTEVNPPSGSSNDRWLLVAGADQTDEAALYEVEQLQKHVDNLQKVTPIENAQIYQIRSWRRTVVPFKSREDAEAALLEMDPELRNGGYIRAEANWCSHIEPLETVNDVEISRCDE